MRGGSELILTLLEGGTYLIFPLVKLILGPPLPDNYCTVPYCFLYWSSSFVLFDILVNPQLLQTYFIYFIPYLIKWSIRSLSKFVFNMLLLAFWGLDGA